MPLLDHFRPPLFPTRGFESFHARWANALADLLDRTLPRRFFAEIQTHLGNRIETDVAEFERLAPGEEPAPNGSAAGGVAVALQTWAPPVAALVMPAVFPDDVEVQVFDEEDDRRLVGVVELVSPGNKDRADNRRAFGMKSAAYLQRGVGLIVADIVTPRHFNLHNEMVRLMGLPSSFEMAEDATIYATAYRPLRRQERNEIDVWPVPLTVGGPLPLLPLALRGFRAVPLDLEAAYTDACQRSRL